jgi:hypothetical protein
MKGIFAMLHRGAYLLYYSQCVTDFGHNPHAYAGQDFNKVALWDIEPRPGY